MDQLGLALAGAPLEAQIVVPDGQSRPICLPASFLLKRGDRLVLGRMLEGARTYLAVKHGFQTVASMGSRSTEETVKRGDVVPALSSSLPSRRLVDPLWRVSAADPVRIIAGPDALLVGPEFWNRSTFRVGSQSNRMGLRLEGPALASGHDPDRLSAPVAPGAIQAAGGQLIVLGVACGTMGGYPHVAHVISADLDRVGQLRPGDSIRFEPIELEQARALDQASRQAHHALIARVTSLAGDLGT